MKQQNVIDIVIQLFAGADERDWQKVKNTMAKEVLLDYTSMAGGEPTVLSPQQIAKAWAEFLPGFDKTHHQLSDFKVNIQDNFATASYFGKADHFIDDEIWTVEGNYMTELKKEGDNWLITTHKFDLITQSGNASLPLKATEIMKSRTQ
jgi:hypothetical protein